MIAPFLVLENFNVRVNIAINTRRRRFPACQSITMPFDAGQQDLFGFNHAEFDFNIQFEQLFFSIVPSVVFIVASSWRAASQLRKPTLVKAPVFQYIKLVREHLMAAHQLGIADVKKPDYHSCLSDS